MHHANTAFVTSKIILMRFTYLLVFLLLIKQSFGQSSIKEYILKNAKTITSIYPNDTNFTDLEILRKTIGTKRIVMLGELYHGDGTSVQAKTRLIKFLHERMGFNVLVFESDFFSLNDGWQLYEDGGISLDSLIYLSIYPLWTKCSQFQWLTSYVNQSKAEQKLVLSGMDFRGYTGYSIRYLYKAIDSFLRLENIPFVKNEKAYSDYCSLLKQAPALVEGRSKTDMNKLLNYTNNILAQLQLLEIKDSFYIKVLQGQVQLFKMAKYYKYDSSYILTKKNYPLHDFQMAENLKWLVRSKYTNEKIIVWAHNTHIAKGTAINANGIDYNSMGDYFTQDTSLLNQTYIIGFTSFSGKGRLILGNVSPEIVTKPDKNSIENWMHTSGIAYNFVDFSNLNNSNIKSEPFYMKTYINTEKKLDWCKYYDGVFFIDKMRPCESVNNK